MHSKEKIQIADNENLVGNSAVYILAMPGSELHKCCDIAGGIAQS